MNALIQKYIQACEVVATAEQHACICEEQAENAKPPKKLRAATASDLAVIGQLVWYPELNDRKWCLVYEVEHYGDRFKAFTAHDGCRYGLDGAFVEIESKVKK